MAKTELHGNKRDRHRSRYWKEHDRATYECPRCERGPESVEWFEVHHKDHDPTNGDLSNLVALCRKCHYEEHGRTPPESLSEWKERVEDL